MSRRIAWLLAKQFRRIAHCQPFAILLGGAIGVDAMHPSQRADTMGCPGFPLAGAHSHPVQGRCNMFVGPSSRHAADHSQGFVGRAAAMFVFGLRTRN